MIQKLKLKYLSDKHFNELLSGSSISLIFRIIGIALSYTFTLIVAHVYGAETMGIYSLSITILSIGVLFGKLGMDTTLLRLVAEYRTKYNNNTIKYMYFKVMKVVIPISVIIAIGIYFLSPLIAHYIFDKHYLTEYFQLASLGIVPFVLLSINRESIRGLKNVMVYSLLTNISVVTIATVLLIYFSFINRDPIVPLFAQILAILIASVISLIYWFRELNKLSKKNISEYFIKYKEILVISIPMLITASMGLIISWTDTIMLGVFATDVEVGVYNVAMKMSMIISLSLVAINTIAAPKFAEFWGRKDMLGLSKVAQQSTKLIFWTSFPLVVFTWIFPEWIMRIFGKEFIVGSTSLILLSFSQLINAMTGSVTYILQMTGKQYIVQYIVFFSAIINILMNYFLIPIYGINGAAIASMASLIFWNVGAYIFVRSSLKIDTLYLPFRSVR